MEILFGFWLICGVGAAMIASSKNRSGCAWFIGGMLLGPIALLIVGFMAPATVEVIMPSEPQDERVQCPHCAEWIMPEAKVCRFCNRSVVRRSQRTI